MGKGKYSAAKPILLKSGKPFSDRPSQSPCLADWDGDGDHDIIMGFRGGPVKFFTNEGSLTFVEQGDMRSDGKAIDGHDVGPCIVDWNGDGMLDLLLGDGDGRVLWYPGLKRGSRDLGKAQTLLPGNPVNEDWIPRKPDPKSPVGFSPAMPGARTKPFAADWNGDGKLDLLVGDYIMMDMGARALTEREKSELASLEKRRRQVSERISKATTKAIAAAYKKVGKKQGDPMTPAESKTFSDTYRAITRKDTEYLQAQADYISITKQITVLKPTPEGTGLVWVYLRK